MKNRDLKRLNRAELLEILIAQSEEIDRLKSELKRAETKLRNREIRMENCGSIAEASLAIYRIVEKTQQAADLYLENIKRKAEGGAGSEESEKDHTG